VRPRAWGIVPDRQHYPAHDGFRAASRTSSHNPEKARQLLAEAGYPNGFDAGELTADSALLCRRGSIGELSERRRYSIKMRVVERAAFYAPGVRKRSRGCSRRERGVRQCRHAHRSLCLLQGRTPWEASPDLDELFEQQAVERDPAKREALLHRIQQLMVERVMFAPVYEFRVLMGRRVKSRRACH